MHCLCQHRVWIYGKRGQISNLSLILPPRLNVSQPAASAQIKALEGEFGVRFFDRKPSGLALTPIGAALMASEGHVMSIGAPGCPLPTGEFVYLDGVGATTRGISSVTNSWEVHNARDGRDDDRRDHG